MHWSCKGPTPHPPTNPPHPSHPSSHTPTPFATYCPIIPLVIFNWVLNVPATVRDALFMLRVYFHTLHPILPQTLHTLHTLHPILPHPYTHSPATYCPIIPLVIFNCWVLNVPATVRDALFMLRVYWSTSGIVRLVVTMDALLREKEK